MNKMGKEAFAIGALLFFALLPFAFRFNSQGIHWLLAAQPGLGWISLAAAAIIWLIIRPELSSSTRYGLLVALLFLPLSFVFSRGGIHFILLSLQPTLILGYAVLAGLVLVWKRQ